MTDLSQKESSRINFGCCLTRNPKFNSFVMLIYLYFILLTMYVSLAAAVFDWKLANVSVELSRLAYCEDTEATLHSNIAHIPKDLTILTNMLGTKGFVAKSISESTIYVVYAGTDKILDWVVDFDAELVKYDGCDECEVHQGFQVTEKIGFPLVLFEVSLQKFMHPSYSVVVAGHSKGAAEATIAAADFIDAGIPDIFLVNFGSPRVGNTAFAEFVSSHVKNHYRVTHHTDTVPSVPSKKQGYKHIDGEWYENPVGHVHQCNGYEDPTCSVQWEKYVQFNILGTSRGTSGAEEEQEAGQGLGGTNSTVLFALPELWSKRSEELRASEHDHLHYLGREMRCPLNIPVATTSAAAVNTLGSTRKEIGSSSANSRSSNMSGIPVVVWGLLVLLGISTYVLISLCRSIKLSPRNTGNVADNSSFYTEVTPLLIASATVLTSSSRASATSSGTTGLTEDV